MREKRGKKKDILPLKSVTFEIFALNPRKSVKKKKNFNFIHQVQMAGWMKKVVDRKNYVETVQFYAKLSTNGLIFLT